MSASATPLSSSSSDEEARGSSWYGSKAVWRLPSSPNSSSLIASKYSSSFEDTVVSVSSLSVMFLAVFVMRPTGAATVFICYSICESNATRHSPQTLFERPAPIKAPKKYTSAPQIKKIPPFLKSTMFSASDKPIKKCSHFRVSGTLKKFSLIVCFKLLTSLEHVRSDCRKFQNLVPRSERPFCPVLLFRKGRFNLLLDLLVIWLWPTDENISDMKEHRISYEPKEVSNLHITKKHK